MESENNTEKVYDHNGTLVVILASENNDNRYTLYDYKKIRRRIKRSLNGYIKMPRDTFDRKFTVRRDFSRLDTLEVVDREPLNLTLEDGHIHASIKGREFGLIDIILDIFMFDWS